MNNQECNKIIAEFMGWTVKFEFTDDNTFQCIDSRCFKKIANFSKSLDALIPVWEKCPFTCQLYMNLQSDIYSAKTPFHTVGNEDTLDITEAAAHATALCIQEINK